MVDGRHRLPLELLLAAVLLAGGCAVPGEQAAFETWESTGAAAGYGDGRPELPKLDKAAALNDYVRYAALNNPGLEAAFNRWKAALERVPQVRSLPDPRFTYKYYVEQVETRVGPQRHAASIAQTFPWFGKLELRGSMALETANAARQRYEAAKLRLFYRVRKAYYEYYYLARAIDTVTRNRDLVKHLEGVARVRYKAAAAGHPDVVRAQVELGKLEDRLRTLKDLRSPIVARLNAALNRPASAPLPWPTEIPRAKLGADDAEVLAWLRAANPQLKALRHEITKQRHGTALARKQYYPNVTLGVTYVDTGSARMPGVRDSGKDPVIGSLSINLPIWYGKYRAGEREANAKLLAAAATRLERENTLTSDLKMVLYRFRDAERKMDLYRNTLLPKARQSLKASETAFRAGRTDFSDLIDAERVLLEFELLYERSRANREQRIAELEMLTGKSFTRSTVAETDGAADRQQGREQQ
jgi:outer membrane protein TolC